MRMMVEEFHDHLAHVGLNAETRERFDSLLGNSAYDMEDLIEYVERLEHGQESQRALGFPVNDQLLHASRTMRWEAEWFVQHACERFRPVEAKVLWGATLRNLGDHELCVATSNYDRLFEVSCGYWGVPFDDGFGAFGDGEAARWRGVAQPVAGKPSLLKVHGSTDWYKGRNGSIYKLRHSMPLYGDLSLALGGGESSLPKLTSALILPTREKLVNEPPYPDLITSFRNVARATDVAIFVGTSLRDPDLRDVCRQCAGRVPTYLVTMAVGAVAQDVQGLSTIESTASGFITSTLPRFLAAGDVAHLDACARGESRTTGRQSILSPLVTALGEPTGAIEVCGAIDDLVDYGVYLDVHDIEMLVNHDDLSVRKYGLALIPKSINVPAGMAIAQEQALREGPGPFAEELSVLVDFMRDKRSTSTSARQLSPQSK